MAAERDKVEFRLLEWDRGPEFFGGSAYFSKHPDNAIKQWFCVRAVGRHDGRPKRIVKYDVTVSIEGLLASEIVVDKDEGWCHHNFTFQARLGRQKVVVRSEGRLVMERDVTFKDICDQEDAEDDMKSAMSAVSPPQVPTASASASAPTLARSAARTAATANEANGELADGLEHGYPSLEDNFEHLSKLCTFGTELSMYCPGERGCAEKVTSGKLRFGLLDDKDEELWSTAVASSSVIDNACECSFRVYCIGYDQKVMDIARHDVSLLISAGRKIKLQSKLDGPCLACTFQAKFGRLLVQVYSARELVLERVVRLKDAHAELWWASKGDDAEGLPAAGIVSAQYSNGQGKDGYADLQKFRHWARNDDWAHFGPKHNHYDWWMFPIHTRASKPKYAVGTGEVAELKADATFMRRYYEGVHLMLRSWGWDLKLGKWCDPRHPHQHWRNWSVRLAKVAESLATFDEMLLFNKVRDFLVALLAEEREERQALTKANHTQMGQRIVVERQFGIDPRDIMMVWPE